MADNLGTLWFGADIDLNQLKQKIQQGNQSILDALKMNYDPQSYQNMVNNLRSALNNETFQIKISTDAQNVAQNLRQQFSSITSGGQGVNLSGLTGINGMTRDILDQKSAIRDTKAEVDALKEAWQRAAAQYGKNSMQARAAQSAYDRANRDLRTSRYELSGMNIERGRATLAQKALNDQMRQASAAAKQLSSDHLRLNTTLAGGIHISTQLGSALSSLFAVHAAKQFLDNVIEIGGQLEKQRISMGAIIGDTARANELFEQIKDLAIKSPFGVVELDQYSKQLAAYGIEQSKLFDMTKRLADISAGAGQDIGRLALALGHVKSATYLTGITLRQFSMNNIPMLKMLADYYTEVEKRAVSTAEVQKRISNRQVSYEDVEEQIKRMTDEGGQFFNMQEKISESLSAKFKNLKDSFDIMYGEIAESKVGDFLKGIASILTSMSRNWKEFAVLIGAAAAAIGTYKLALLPVNKAMMQFGQETVLTSTRLNAQRIAMGLSTAETKALSAATIDVMVKQGLLSKQQLLTAVATKKLTVAQAELAATNFNVTKGELLRIASMGRLGLAMRSLTVGVKSLGVALKGLMFNPFTIVLTAITAAAELFMHFKNKSDEAKQSVKDMVNTANEGFENIQDVLKKFPEKVIDAGTMSGGIKEITEALKNYAPNANNILEEANAITDLAERYAFLRGELKSTENAYADLENTADYVVNANNKTGNLINDTFTEQVEDYLGDLRDVRKAEQEFMYHRIAINNALEKIAKGVPEFAKGRYDEEGNLKSLKEQIELLKNIQIPNVGSAFSQFSQVLAASNNDASVALNKWSAALSDADKRMRDEVLPDLIKFAQKLDDSYKGTKGWGENWKQNGDHVKTAIIAITKELEKVPDMTDTVKNELLDKIFNEQWHLDIKFTTEEAEEELTGWQKEMQDYFDKNHIYIRLSMSSTREDVIKQIEAERKKAQEIADNAGQVLIGIGFKLNKLPTNLPTPLATPWNQNALEDYQQQTDYVNKLNAAIDKYNLNVNNKAADKARKAAESAANKAKREAEKRAKDRTKMAEAQLKIDEELAKQRLELEDAIADAEVAAIKNNSARERAQRLNEMRKQERDLKKQVEEWKKTAFKALKEKYEADPNNKKVSFYDTPEGKAGWQGIPLTKEQEETYKQRWATMLATGEKSLKELVRAEHKANADAIQKYIEQFGTYEEKKKAIYEKANDEICDLQEQLTDDMTDEERQAIDAQIALVKKGAQDQVDELDVKYGKAKAILIDLFEDASEKSITEIEKIIKKYEALVKYLKGEDNVSREDLISFGFTEKEIDKIVEKIEKEGVSSIKDFTEQIKKLKGELGNRSPWMSFSVNIGKAIEKIKNAKGENKGSEIGTGIEEIGRSIQDILPSVESFGESVANLFQTNDADFRQTIQRLKDLGGLVEGIGKIASKDYFGGIMQAGQSLINIIGSFSAQKEQEKEEARQERLERLRNSIEAANDSIQRLTEELEKSYGIEALRLEEEQKKRVAENQKRAVKGLNELGLGSLDETFNFFDNQWQSAAGAIGARYGKQFGLSWLSWTKDALDNDIIKDYADDFRLSIESIEKLSELGNQYVWYPVTGLNGSWEELLKDPEKLAKTLAYIRKFDEGLWGDLIAINDETAEWLTALADSADQWEKIELKAKEQITGTSFDSVFDSFMNGLYEFANGTEDAFGDIADNWQKMINKMVINNLIGQKVKEELQAWYKLWDAAYTGDKDIDEDELAELQKKYNKIWTDAESEIKTMTEKGIIKPIEKYFESLLDSWKSTLTDMSQSAKDWKNSLIDQVFNDLVESTILDVPIDVDTTEGEKHFDDFAKYIKDWTDRYKKVMEDTTLTDEQRNEKLKALIKEQTDVREAQAEKSKKIAESIGKDITEAFSNSLDGLGSTLLDGLLDTEKDAAQMGKEIGQTLVREMIQELLASEKYSGQINAIKKLWQNVLKGGGTWVDEQGLFGEANTVYNVDKVIGKITELDDAMANDDEITALTEKYRQFGYVAESSFGNLKDTFMDAVLDMEHGAENFAKKLNETLVKDLVNKKVFGEAFTLNGKEFANFDVYQKDWTKRYLDALEKGDKALMKELTKELRNREKEMAKSAEEYAKTLQDVAEDTTFKDMSDDFLNAVMDINKTAEDWGQQIGETMVKKILEGMLLKDKIMPIMEGIQKAFNDAVSAATNKETGKINWEEVINNPALTASVESGKKDFNEFQTAWKMLCETFGVELNTLPLENIGDTVIDSLLDIEDSAEDFGRRMALQLMNEMLTTMVSNEFKEKIQTIRKMWQSVVNGDGEYTMQQVLDEIQDFRDAITKNEAANGLINSIKELSKTSEKVFSSMADSWTSTLMDMEGTAEDFVKSVGKMMAEKIITAMITPKFIQPILNAMQEAYDVAVNAAGATYKSVVSAMVPFLDQLKDVYEVVTPMIEEIFGSFGIFRETVEEVEEAVDEVEYALGDLKSEFSSALMDMESTAESFSKNIKNILAKTFVEKFILGDRFDAMMEQWQQQFEGILTGSMSDDQRKKSIQKLAESMTDYEQSLVGPVMSLLESLGLTTEDNQQATMNMSDKITYDQADQLLGINLAQELTLEQILAELQGKEILNVGSANRSLLRTSELMGNDEQGKLINATLTNIAQMTQQNHDNIMTQVAMANSHLQMIRDYNKRMCDQIELHMASMDTKLNNLSRL